jgi:glycyl-tRNA synthetase beta chain
MKKDFLLEIGTEELPPKNLQTLQEKLYQGISDGLSKAGLNFNTDFKCLAAPRRLAVIISQLDTEQLEQLIERRGPAVSAPQKAIEGFAQSCGTTLDQLHKEKTDKGEYFIYRARQAGKKTIELLPAIVSQAIKQLPIPKPMRWGNGDGEFIRPVHWILMLLGNDIVPAEIFGKKAGRITYGHRFHAPQAIEITSPSEYEAALEKANVMVDFEKRKQKIEKAREACQDNNIIMQPELLSEVTAIVEWPVILKGYFEEKFLSVPQEALISAMQGHQKSFPMLDRHTGKLINQFTFVSNIESKDPAKVIEGNEKVMRARLSDAHFFYETDSEETLEDMLERLKPVVFQDKVGSMYDRAVRISKLAG